MDFWKKHAIFKSIIKNLIINKYFLKHEIVIVTFLFNDTKIYFLNIFITFNIHITCVRQKLTRTIRQIHPKTILTNWPSVDSLNLKRHDSVGDIKSVFVLQNRQRREDTLQERNVLNSSFFNTRLHSIGFLKMYVSFIVSLKQRLLFISLFSPT